jgi:hypothetical protein
MRTHAVVLVLTHTPQGAAPFSEDNAKQLVTKVLTGSAITLPLPVSALLLCVCLGGG